MCNGNTRKGEKRERRDETNGKQSNMVDLALTISIATLNINGLNIPLKRKISSDHIKK